MTKERMKEYRRLKQEVEQLRELAETTRARMISPKSQNFSGMPRGGGNGSEDALIAYADLISLYEQTEKFYLEETIEIEKAIEAVNDANMRTLLRYRYLQVKKWEDICYLMNYSWQGIHKLHRKALAEVSK